VNRAVLVGLLVVGLTISHASGVWAGRASVRTPFRREVANIEYFRGRLVPDSSQIDGDAHSAGGMIWRGYVAYGPTRPYPFTARYINGLPVAVTLADGSTPHLYLYPGGPGTRSFHLTMPPRSSVDRLESERSSLLRIVLESGEGTDKPPGYRAQLVYARTGWFSVQGDSFRAFLYDGDQDGVYSRDHDDGIFVDLNCDRSVEVDGMSTEFGPFSVPFQLGGTMFSVSAVHPDGDWIDVTELGLVKDQARPAVGAAAPQIECLAYDGRPIRLADYVGKVTLLYFWASWCSACRFQAPDLRDLYREFHPRGLEILGFSYDDSASAMRAHLARYRHDWLTYFSSGRRNWEDPIARAYGARGEGVLYLVDREGKYQGSYTRIEEIRSRLTSLLAP
jgi:peroxiredoxin